MFCAASSLVCDLVMSSCVFNGYTRDAEVVDLNMDESKDSYKPFTVSTYCFHLFIYIMENNTSVKVLRDISQVLP
ncbi:hypothetical protein VNO78_06478 [Psophocarpus tetragonolobus]|uniref:Uncharacterized protein n=1 Tax=Psophocarpus tetragonolobus TaxID=3891 RepID=A0AAN9XRM4_PSOTE